MILMTDLFSDRRHSFSPLADRMRPQNFEEFFGQKELVASGSPLRESIEKEHVGSLIFWGPPGSGKTTLSLLIAKKTNSYFKEFSAVSTGINEVRQAISWAEDKIKFEDKKTIIFIDEIHRFNKAQQDALLPYVERGSIILIGATTENPSFEVISPLLSRLKVYVLKSLSKEDLVEIMKQALQDKERGIGKTKIKIEREALDFLANWADGDARAALNGLEFVVNYAQDINLKEIGLNEAKKALKTQILRYDKGGEEHYNLISAFIKCLRDSDADASLYWLARMVQSGEDPKFIARRMMVFASEDIGNSDPVALTLAASIVKAVEFVGLPEAEINLAQGVTYLASAPKDRSSYDALLMARQDAAKGSFGVPMHLRNAVTDLMKEAGYGKKSHAKSSNFPDEIGNPHYYDRQRKDL
jgi:putative ATPase